MSDEDAKAEVVLELAEEFLARYRKGERPPLREYIQRRPELAAEIKEVFPAMAMMENIAVAEDSIASSAVGDSAAAPLQQLGDYRIIRQIGHGGMGVVYEAEQISLGRHVALKVLSPQVRDTKHRRRFAREAKAAAKLHHTNIVPIFGVGEQDGQPYYVMQFIQGLGLDAVLKELQRLSGDTPESPQTLGRDAAAAMANSLVTGAFAAVPGERLEPTRSTPDATPTASAVGDTSRPSKPLSASAASSSAASSSAAFSLSSTSAVLPGQSDNGASKITYWQSVAQIGIQVASALEYAHKQGVLHRDIKPSNLLLDTNGTVWVTDFGLAKAEGQEDLTHTGDVLGTVRYMPPEAFDGKADARGDVYSLGLTLFELVSLRRAFSEKDRRQLIKQVTLEEPPRLERIAPSVPRDLATIVQTAIAKEPKRRYQTAREFAEDLQRFADDRPIQARRVGAVERAWRWSHRNPLAAALTVAVVVLLVAASALSTVLGVQATMARDRADASAREAIENALKVTEERNKAVAEKDRADREADAARINTYVLRLNSVQMALENRNVAWAMELLKLAQPRDTPSESMGWDWRYSWRFCHGELRTLESHVGDVTGLAVHPDGTRLVSCSIDKTLREWDPATGQQLRSLSLKGFSKPVIALNADGTRLAMGSGEGIVRILDANNWQELQHFKARSRVRSLAFSADGARLVTAGDDRNLTMWSVAGAHEIRTYSGHTGIINCVAFSPDGRWLASGSEDATVRLWNAATGQAVHTLRSHTAALNCLAFSPDGGQLASAGRDWGVRIWDHVSGRELHTLTGHTSEVRALAFSPDGSLLASAGHDRTLKVWDLSSAKERSSHLGHRMGLYSLAFSPDGRWLASGSSDTTIRLWSTTRDAGGRIDKSHANQVRAVEFSPDGRWLASVGLDGKIVVRDVVTGQTRILVGESSTGLLALAISPDGQLLATAGDAGIVAVWNADTGRSHFRVKAHTSWTGSLAFSPDGRTLATGSHDKTIKLLDAATGQVLKTLEGHTDEIRGLEFTSDGRRLVSGSVDLSIKIWDVDSGRQMQTLTGHTNGVTCVALSHDNRRLASSSHDNTVKIWDMSSGRELHTLTGHGDSVWRVRFLRDSARVVSASFDQSIRVWDSTTGFELALLKGHTDRVLDVAVSPDGGLLASAGGRDLTVRVWDGRPLTDATQLEQEAVDLLNFLFSRPLRKTDVIAYLNSAPALRPALRKLAAELAERYGDNADSKAFHDAAWRIVKHPHANATMCQFALLQATASCEQSPDNVQYCSALAAAQVRLGKFQKEFLPRALATLNQCDASDPATMAFLAITQHRLDEKEKARTTLARLQLIMQDPSAKVGADAEALFHEAGLLIDGFSEPKN